jgi:isoleucyl-tRNA synthetase
VHRQSKAIGSSLEASPIVYISNQDLFDQVKSIDFAEVCITSEVKLKLGSITKTMFCIEDVEGVGVIFKSAEGKKCARCWKYVESFSDKSGYDDVCERCSNTLNLQH